MPQNPFWVKPSEHKSTGILKMQEDSLLPAFLFYQQIISVLTEKIPLSPCAYRHIPVENVPKYACSTGYFKVRQKNYTVNLWKNLWRM